MEKIYNSKIALASLFLMTCISPFGLFIYAFGNVVGESLLSLTAQSLDHITVSELSFSIAISVIATMMSVLIGGLMSYYLLNFRKSDLGFGILNIVLVLPHIGFAYIIYLFFSNTGFLFRFLDLFGITTEINPVNDIYGIGIIINYALKEIPFVILYLLATNNSKNKHLIFTAKDLGASFLHCFYKIYVPLNLVQLTSISIVIFAFILGNYEVPFLLGSNTPQFLSVSALNNFQSINIDQNIASYLKVIIIFFTAFTFSIGLRLLSRTVK